MTDSDKKSKPAAKAVGSLRRAAPVIIVGSVMFSFISYWRAAAIVLCDLASTAFYIGGIVEQAIGPAAPWFILGVLLFSYAVRSLYIESCSLYVRGGVYRVVKDALGGLPAKGAVSALLFDYILTGPISSVSAGQYLTGLIIESIAQFNPSFAIEDQAFKENLRRFGSVLVACAITLYFFRKNLMGLHESSDKALKIMGFTTVVAVIVLAWCGLTLALRGPVNKVPFHPDLSKKIEYEVVEEPDPDTGQLHKVWKRNPETGALVPKLDADGKPVPLLDKVTGRQVDPLGFLPYVLPGLAADVRQPVSLFTLLGLFGIVVAFGHSILAMSGEETMAQVYREVESPKLQNFQKAAFVIFVYSVTLTVGVSFLAVLLIPDEVRMKDYADNLLGGLAMHVVGPPIARLLLNALVVVTGFLILAGAVNTSIIGCNGVLNRVAEDGVLPGMLQRPHRRYGTTYRILYLIVGLQLFTIIASRGDMILLGEAYAFGVIWSFLFNAISMLVLRIRDKSPREFKVPLNVQLGSIEIPIGLGLIFLVLLSTALTNLFTKDVATVGGITFTAIILSTFVITEQYTRRSRAHGKDHEHLEQFTAQSTDDLTPERLGLSKPFRKLVAIRSPQSLFMLQKTLEETDPDTTEVIVMTAKTTPPGTPPEASLELDEYDQRLMTAVMSLDEKAGKQIKPLVVPTNNPMFALINTARSLKVQELIVGASQKYSAEELLDQMALYWINLHGGQTAPLTIRVLSKGVDVHFDIGGGARVPRIGESKARTVAELRAGGVGVQRALLIHNATPEHSDVFESVLTMLDPEVGLGLLNIPGIDEQGHPIPVSGSNLQVDLDLARKLGRPIEVHELHGAPGPETVRLVRELDYDIVIVPVSPSRDGADECERPVWIDFIRKHAVCPLCLITLPAIPREVGDLLSEESAASPKG